MVKKQSKGRQKVEMKKMTNDSNLQVTFSKRRAGLFKKASELCTLCGAEIAIVVFSPGKNVFSFGHPEVDALIERYLSRNPPKTSGTLQLVEAHRNAIVRELNMELTEVLSQLEAEKKRGEELDAIRKSRQGQWWWQSPVEELSLPKLLQLKSVMEELKEEVDKHADRQLLIQNMNSQQFFMGSTSCAGMLPYDDMKNMNSNSISIPPPEYTAQEFSTSHSQHMNMIPPPGFNNISTPQYPNPEGYDPNSELLFNPGFGHDEFLGHQS